MAHAYDDYVNEKGQEALRQLWRSFGATVSVVSTANGTERRTMLATAVSSLAFEPPSLLICLNQSASAHDALIGRGVFSVGLLDTSHHELALHIASAPTGERFAKGDWHRLAPEAGDFAGIPYLAEAQATLFCRVDGTMPYGTHTVVIGQIGYLKQNLSGPALQYCDGAFGTFAKA